MSSKRNPKTEPVSPDFDPYRRVGPPIQTAPIEGTIPRQEVRRIVREVIQKRRAAQAKDENHDRHGKR